jgi:hypothetical protein
LLTYHHQAWVLLMTLSYLNQLFAFKDSHILSSTLRYLDQKQASL